MKTIIFDMDGTLADSLEVVLDIVHEVTGSPRPNEAEVEHLRSLPPLKMVKKLGIKWRLLPRLAREWRKRMHKRMNEVHPYRGIPSAVKALHEQGHHLLVISSNSEQNVRKFLRANRLERYFSGVYGNVKILGKAGALRAAIHRNSIDKSGCYYIGDEVRDVVAAKRVGIHAVAVSWGFQNSEALLARRPDVMFNRPSELAPWFLKEVEESR